MSCATSPRRTARTISSARASSASRSSSSSTAGRSSWRACCAFPNQEARSTDIEARFLQPARPGAGGRAAAAAGAARNCSPPSPIIAIAGRARRLHGRNHGHHAGGEAGNPRDHRCRRAHGQGVAAARASHRGAAAVAGDRPADQGRARRAPARGAAARADGRDPEAARRRRRRQGAEMAELERGDHQGRDAEGSRGAGAQGAAPAASACRKPPPNTAWCAPISTG